MGLFPPEPEKYAGPKLKVAGLAGMSTVLELFDQGQCEFATSLCEFACWYLPLCLFYELVWFASRHMCLTLVVRA